MHRSTWLGFLVVLVGGCSSGAAPDPASVPRDPYPDARDFFENIRNYPYVAPTERSTRIALGSEKLRVCMTKSEVRSLLGAPDYSEVNYGPKGPMPRWLGYAWTYYQSIKGDVVNTHDPHIEIFFDKGDCPVFDGGEVFIEGMRHGRRIALRAGNPWACHDPRSTAVMHLLDKIG